jgi:hypothetical protein
MKYGYKKNMKLKKSFYIFATNWKPIIEVWLL